MRPVRFLLNEQLRELSDVDPTLTVLEWPDLDGERGAMILDTVRAQTRALLEMWSRGG